MSRPALPIFFFFLLLAAAASCVAATHRQGRAAALAQALDSILGSRTPRPFSGVMLVAQGSQVLYCKAHGWRGPADAQARLRTSTGFVLGSLSKQVTAVLVLQACADGRMALQEPIARFLPYPAPAWADSVTPHHLLCHTSGYQGMDKALAFSPGQRFSYSNQGYALLGRIVAEAQGGSYADLVARLFRRCGMGRSRFPSADLPADVAVGMSHPDSARAPQYAQAVDAAFAPAGGLVSTARDLWRWNQALHGGRLLSGAHYAQMTAASSTRPHPIFGDVDYGYGLQYSRVDGIHEISHGGYYPGFVTVNFYYPETQTSLVVLENLDWLDPAFKLSFHWEMQARKLLRDSGLLRPQNR